MENLLWYLSGLGTPIAVGLLLLLWAWLRDKNWQVDCLRCGRSFGEIDETYKRVTWLKFWWHRRNGQCRRNS